MRAVVSSCVTAKELRHLCETSYLHQCLTIWLLLRWIDGATTAASEGCGSLCRARVTNEGGRFDLDTFRFMALSTLLTTPKRWSLRDV
ncbi:hypothetical protein TNCV_2922861 [Trichonephila clavipes]|nr:hypothetical protein TNCV_2922861 [Trichonephila clavipes]